MDTHPSDARSERGKPRSMLPAAIAIAALIVGASGQVALAAQPEVPGNNGTVKIHEGAGEPASEVRNEPHVCTFHLHFFFADAGDSGTWEIQEWSPGDKGAVAMEGTYETDENGEDRDPDDGVYELPDGHYKLFWDGDLDTDKHDKHKVFWVECEDQGGRAPTPPGGDTGGGGPTPPGGAVGGGGGGGGGVLPTVGTAPAGGVGGVVATPAITLPPTDTPTRSAAGSGGLWATLLLLLVIGTTVTLATVPVASIRRRRRR